MVDTLDLSAFHARYEGDGRRRQPFDPAMMVKVLVYGYATGVVSSRVVARKLRKDVAFRVLAAENFRAHRTLREFRQLHLDALSELFVQVVRLAHEAGLVKLGRLGVDGTKVGANASKRKAMSYARMQTEEARLKHEIAELLKRAEAVDCEDNARLVVDATGEELPAELARRESRLKTIEAAKARLEARQREVDRERGRHGDDDRRPPGRRGRRYAREFGVPEDKAQENFTDPHSRIMNTGDGFQQCYNAQAAVDEGSQLIVGVALDNVASDVQQLVPMLGQGTTTLGECPQMLLADVGYASEANFIALEALGQPACVSLGREGKDARRIDAQRQPATARMAERLATA